MSAVTPLQFVIQNGKTFQSRLQDELAGWYNVKKSQKVECGSSLNHVATDLIHLICWWAWASETDDIKATRFSFADGGGSRIPRYSAA